MKEFMVKIYLNEDQLNDVLYGKEETTEEEQIDFIIGVVAEAFEKEQVSGRVTAWAEDSKSELAINPQ